MNSPSDSGSSFQEMIQKPTITESIQERSQKTPEDPKASDGPNDLRPIPKGWLPGLFIPLGLLCFFSSLYLFFPLTVDDAFISFRYAQNLVSGHGLVFNPGEFVEGYTNFLWTLMTAIGLQLGFQAEGFARGTGWLCTVGGLWCCWHFAKLFFQEEHEGWPAATLFLCLLSAPLTYWAGAGLEGSLFLLLWAGSRLGIAKITREGSWYLAALCLLLLPFCRPDGVLFVVTGLLWLWFNKDESSKSFWFILGILLLGGTGYASWKLWYYGDLLPNTFHAKVNAPGSVLMLGLRYFWRFLWNCPWLLLLPLGGLWLRLSSPQSKEQASEPKSPQWTTLLLMDCLLFCAYILYVGGDAMPYSRFFVPLVPPLALLTVKICALLTTAPSENSELRRRLLMRLILVAGLCTFAFSFRSKLLRHAINADRITRLGVIVGQYLKKTSSPNTLIAINAAGAIPYFSGLPTIDMLGLNDAHIAKSPVPKGTPVEIGHTRGNGNYVLTRAPKIILMGNTSGDREPMYLSDWLLTKHPKFASLYQLHAIHLHTMKQTLTRRRPASVRYYFTTPTTERFSIPFKIFKRIGLMEKYISAGPLLTLREYWAINTKIYLFIKRDTPLPIQKMQKSKP